MRGKSSTSVRVFFPPFTLEELLQLIRLRIPALRERLPLRRVVIFGSYAKGRQTAASDVDLLVIYAGERREDAFKIVKRTLNIPRLEPHVYSEEEYQKLKPTVERMAKGGIEVPWEVQ